MNAVVTSRSRTAGPGFAEGLLALAIFGLTAFQIYQSTKVGSTPRGTAAREALQHSHISIGLTVLPLVIARLWLWPRARHWLAPSRVPVAAESFARACILACYLTLLALCLTGPLFAWSAGHDVAWFGVFTLPDPMQAGYRASVTLGYLHSATGFWILLLIGLTVLVAIWQALRYRARPWRLLPAFGWGGRSDPAHAVSAPAPARARIGAGWRSAHLLAFGTLIAVAAWMPYRIFGVVPFTTGRQLVASGPAPAVDPYAGATTTPALSAKTQKDFMWCRFCHTFETGGAHGVGPNLHRVFGRRAASAPGFYYSPAFVEAGQNGLVWDAAAVSALIGDPAAFLEGKHRMRYAPITDPNERTQIVEALRVATK